MKKSYVFLIIAILCFSSKSTIVAQRNHMLLHNNLEFAVMPLFNTQKYPISGTKEIQEIQNSVNVTFAYKGSLFLRHLTDEDSKFYIGDYAEAGAGVGMGTFTVKNTGQPDEERNLFNLGFLVGYGVASHYKIKDDLTVGLKFIGWGVEGYWNFARNTGVSNQGYVNILTVIPSVRYKDLLFSAGIGFFKNDVVKNNFILEGRYILGKSLNSVGVKLQFNINEKEEANGGKNVLSNFGVSFLGSL